VIYNRKFMPRKGRSFEKLVKVLEELGTRGLQIKSPDFIKDNVTGKLREVDISIRGCVGSHDILVVIECRDRKTKQGVEWIEQISEKTRDIGANKVIAVSSVGFTASAINKAKVKNIDLYTFKEVKPDNVINLVEITHTYFGKNIKQFIVNLISDDSTKKLQIENPEGFMLGEISEEDLNNTNIFRKSNKKQYQISKILESNFSCNSEKLYRDIEPNCEKKLKWITFRFSEKDRCQIMINNLAVEIGSISIQVELWIEKETLTSDNVSQYRTQNEVIAEVYNFRSPQAEFDFKLIAKFPKK